MRIGYPKPGWSTYQETIAVNRRLFPNKAAMPSQALTMGIDTILSAKKILVLAFGEGKAAGAKNILEGQIGWHCQATYLRTHPNVTMILDQAAAKYLPR